MRSRWGLEELQRGLLAGLSSLHSAGTRSCSKSGAFPNTAFLFNQFRKRLTALEAFHIIRNMHSGKGDGGILGTTPAKRPIYQPRGQTEARVFGQEMKLSACMRACRQVAGRSATGLRPGRAGRRESSIKERRRRTGMGIIFPNAKANFFPRRNVTQTGDMSTTNRGT